MKNNALILLFCFISLFSFSSHTSAQNTQIHVTGIRSTKGQIILKIFRDQASFDKEQASKTMTFDKKGVKNGEVTLPLDLAAGTYGITLLDDENGDGKLEKSFVGMPKEGFGFSNFFLEKLKKPAYEEFKTQIKSEDNKVQIKVKYM
jgi:uncharacterized protein (DUF2141 family)